jgi:hypothetical protein
VNATAAQKTAATAAAEKDRFDTEEVSVLINALPPEEADKRHITAS